jgi:hypothetical protein
VNLNNVEINFSIIPPFTSGTYGLIHAGGGITGTPTRGGPVAQGWTLQVNGDRLEVVVP